MVFLLGIYTFAAVSMILSVENFTPYSVEIKPRRTKCNNKGKQVCTEKIVRKWREVGKSKVKFL